MRSEGRRDVLEPSEPAAFGRDCNRRRVGEPRPGRNSRERAVVGLPGIVVMRSLAGSVVPRGVSVQVPDGCGMRDVIARRAGKQLDGEPVGTELERERALRRGHEPRRNERPQRERKQCDPRERGAGGGTVTEEAASHRTSRAEIRAPASRPEYELQGSLQVLPLRRWHPGRQVAPAPSIQVPCLLPGTSPGTCPLVRSMQQPMSRRLR